MRRILQNAGFNAVGSIFDRGSIVALTAMLSGALSPIAFSAFGQFQLTLTMLAAFASVGLAVSTSRIFAEHDAGRSDDLPMIGTMWLLSLFAALCLGLTITLISLVGPMIHTGLPPAFLLLGLTVLTLGVVANGGVLGFGLFREAAIVSIVTAAVVLGIGALAAVQRSLFLAAIAVIAGYGVNSLLASWLIFRRVSFGQLFSRQTLTRDAVMGVGRLVGPLAFVTLLAASGNWLLGQMLHLGVDATRAFSSFVIGLQWYALVQFLPSLLSRAIFPSIVRNSLAESGRAAGRKELWQAAALSVLSAALVAVGIAVLSPVLARLYAPDAVQGGVILTVFAVAALPQSVANMFGNVLVAARLQSRWASLTLQWFAVLLISALALVRYGAIGMAGALFIGGCYLALMAVVAARREGLV